MAQLLGVDVGFRHLALVGSMTKEDGGFGHVTSVDLIDVTCVPCHPGCNLNHSKHIVDRMEHVFAWYADRFDGADEILLEQQPPIGGLVHVEALMFAKYRGKTTMVSPVSMHAFFGLPAGDYDTRKLMTTAIAEPHLHNFENRLMALPRLHDIADALCMCLFVATKRERAAAAARAAELRHRTHRMKLERLRAHDNPANPFSKFARPAKG